MTDTVGGLRERQADCAFLYLPLEDPDLEVTPFLSEQRVVVLLRSHRLLPAASGCARPISSPRLSSSSPRPSQEWRDHWLLVAENGRHPPTSPAIAAKLEDWLHLIATGECIDTAPAVISRYSAWPEVDYAPLVDAEPCTFAIVRRRDTTDRSAPS